MSTRSDQNDPIRRKAGYLYTFAAYVLWGLLPLYWKQLVHVSSMEVMAYRILGSFIFLIMLLTLLRQSQYKDYLRDSRKRSGIFLAGILIAVNWFVFIFAVNSGYIVQASFGYYINPLVSIAFGVLFLKERMTRLQTAAIVMVVATVVYLGVGIGQFPFISLTLALSFGGYGLIKKKMHLDSLHGLLLETIVLVPFMLFYLGSTVVRNTNHLLTDSWISKGFMLLAGFVTVVPLFLFAEGAKRIPLSSVGILQYIAPTMMLFIGVVVYHEAFTTTHAVSLGILWIAIVLYMVSLFRRTTAVPVVPAKVGTFPEPGSFPVGSGNLPDPAVVSSNVGDLS